MTGERWNREQLLLTFNLYCRTPFGRLHRNNPEIVRLAQTINRSPSAVAMKLVNFASLDPIHQARNVRGLSNVSQADREIWDEFNSNPERLAFESQRIFEQTVGVEPAADNESELAFAGETEVIRLVRARLVQRFFRDSVLSSYKYRCAVCRIDLVELLVASHIVPWSKSVERRADPRNGLALCAIHDRAFDRGLITVSDSFVITLSARARVRTANRLHTVALVEIEGGSILLPDRFAPDLAALAYHRKNIFSQ